MYRIYCDDFTLYDPLDKELVLIEPILNGELSKAGSLSFTISPTHPHYSDIKKMQSWVRVEQNGERIFEGRVFSDNVTFNKMKKIEVEGLLALFNDTIVRPYQFKGSVKDYLEFLISQHNQQVSPSRWFELGEVTVSGPPFISRSSSQCPNTWSEIDEKLINEFGGYLRLYYTGRNKATIDYLAKPQNTASQKIEYAVNLLDFENTMSGEELATCIIPYGAVIEPEEKSDSSGLDFEHKGEDLEAEEAIEQRVDITSVNNGEDYIYDEEAVEKYGHIYEAVIWDDVTTPSYLLKKAKAYLQSKIAIQSNITIKAVDLHLSNEEIEAFRLGDKIMVYSKPHGIEEYMVLQSYSLTLNDPTSFVYTLEKSKNSLVASQVRFDRKTTTSINQLSRRILELERKQK